VTLEDWRGILRHLTEIAEDGAQEVDVLVRITRSKTLRLHQVITGAVVSDPTKRVVIWSPVEDPGIENQKFYWDRAMDMAGRIPPY